MRHVSILILLSALVLSSCNEQSSPGNGGITDTALQQQIDLIHGDHDETDRWGYKKYLADTSTPQLAKDIFNNNWQLRDDEPLDFLDNLHGKDSAARPFYFRVVTNSFDKADGAYAEGLGYAGYEYVLKYPGEFSDYFIGEGAFTEMDLQTWADIVMLEMQLIHENEFHKPVVEDYVNRVKKNCSTCSPGQMQVLEKFGSFLQERWRELLKHIE